MVAAAAAAVAAVAEGHVGGWMATSRAVFVGATLLPSGVRAYADLPGPVRAPSPDGGRLSTELDTNSGVNNAVIRTSLPFSKCPP